MPTVTIDDRPVDVEPGTNLVEAARQVGIHVPHYCYHPRLPVVGQCRMCLVEIEGQSKLQAGCSTQVLKAGMVVRTDTPQVQEAQRGVMELLLINHPLDCPICDQAGECGLQDYAFRHGSATSRFRFEDKRTYPGRERIPLGPTVMLNMNRCIQCTRCVRFTQHVTGTGELGFFHRGARAEIGVFPGRQLDSELSTCVVDLCPVGALTSTRFRFAERVWNLDKQPSICTGCDVGCNVTVEHRGGRIRRLSPRHNPAVNDYWMCDHGRGTHEMLEKVPRLLAPRIRRHEVWAPASWKEALDVVSHRLRARGAGGLAAFLGSGSLTLEEAYVLTELADAVASPHRSAWVDSGPPRTIPNPQGGLTGRDAAPNRRGVELVGLRPGEGAIAAEDLLLGDAAARATFLLVADGCFGRAAQDPKVIDRLRRAQFLVVLGWADGDLAAVADVALPTATWAERTGTMVNVAGRLQRASAAFPPPGAAQPALWVLCELLSRHRHGWAGLDAAAVFARLAADLPTFRGLSWEATDGATLGESRRAGA